MPVVRFGLPAGHSGLEMTENSVTVPASTSLLSSACRRSSLGRPHRIDRHHGVRSLVTDVSGQCTNPDDDQDPGGHLRYGAGRIPLRDHDLGAVVDKRHAVVTGNRVAIDRGRFDDCANLVSGRPGKRDMNGAIVNRFPDSHCGVVVGDRATRSLRGKDGRREILIPVGTPVDEAQVVRTGTAQPEVPTNG